MGLSVPLWCILANWVLLYVPSTAKSVYLKRKQDGKYDNVNPRGQLSNLDGWGARAYGAMMNSYETFPVFAAAAVVAHVSIYMRASRDSDVIAAAVLSIAHVVLRLVYILVYIGNYNAKIAALRTVVYVLGMLCILGLFVVSAIAP